jgi:DNA mismatch endonuclease (patch repair protein)
MTDIFNRARRSEIMSHIRGRGNKATELRLIIIFRKYRITGWRRNYHLLGKPDFVFPGHKVVVFTDGCFWHGCPKHFKCPKSNKIFWLKKITRNRQRDREINRVLREKKWVVLRVWQHELSVKGEQRVAKRIISNLS